MQVSQESLFAVTSQTREDVLTGVISVHPKRKNKPMPPAVRIMPPDRSPCPLCVMSSSSTYEDGFATDGQSQVKLSKHSAHTFSFQNLWPVFDDGPSELICPRSHVHAIEDLSNEEACDMLNLFHDRYLNLAEQHKTVFPFINVGHNAGGSLSHLHAQLVTTSAAPAERWERLLGSSHLIEKDMSFARAADLVVKDDASGSVYVAYAPSFSGEIRIVADTTQGLHSLIHDTATALATSIGDWPYNVIPVWADRPFAQLIPRLDVGITYPTYLGTCVGVLNQEAIAEKLRLGFSQITKT